MSWFRKLWGVRSTAPKATAPNEPDHPATPEAERAHWLEASDPRNPFGVRLLDLMGNLSINSGTQDPQVAARAISWRAGDHRLIEGASGLTDHPCNLRYPAADELPDGMLYCPAAMEDKWVVAWRDGEIRVARSWTGDTVAVAPATLRDGLLHVDRVRFDANGPLAALGDPVTIFDWLMRTHPLGNRVPLPVDAAGASTLESVPLAGFSLFGRKLFCAAIDLQLGPASGRLCSDGVVTSAIQQRDQAMLERLLAAGESMTAPSTLGGYRPVHLALVVKSKPVLETLLRHGADANQRSSRGTTPLQAGIAVSCDIELLELLLAHGADIEASDELGFRPLHDAAQTDNAEAVRWLLQKGAQLDARTTNGLAPLHVACGLGSLRAAQALHAGGADLRAASPLGAPPGNHPEGR